MYNVYHYGFGYDLNQVQYAHTIRANKRSLSCKTGERGGVGEGYTREVPSNARETPSLKMCTPLLRGGTILANLADVPLRNSKNDIMEAFTSPPTACPTDSTTPTYFYRENSGMG